MTASELRQKYLVFFVRKGHKIIPSASLIPEEKVKLSGTQRVLFTTAGMHPLIPYFLGEPHPVGNRLVNVQKCLRTDDIDEVGDETHHTFFEMLGNWSFGDPVSPDGIGQGGYFKKEAIEWSFEFLTSTDWLGIEKERLAVSVFAGDDDAPFDQESYDVWLSLGIPESRIVKLPKKDNWWGPAGETGPCGPDTEMFIWAGKGVAPQNFNPDDSNWFEIWNDVFMQYNKTKEGKFKPLVQKNVDTGMGVERVTAILQGKDDDYETELFLPIIKKIEEISHKNYKENLVGFRIIADHLRAAVFLLLEKIVPSNVGQGYVLRRLVRRAIRYGRQLGIEQTFTPLVGEVIISMMNDDYPDLNQNKQFITDQLKTEEEKFKKTIEEGLKRAQKIFEQKTPVASEKYSQMMQTEDKNEIFREIYQREEAPEALAKFGVPLAKDEIMAATITGKEAFDLYQTFGFPIEMIIELVQEKNLLVDVENYLEELNEHQELSRTSSVGMFKGGLADHSEQVTKYHTATHLLQAALREVLGSHVQQKGSNITVERLRFDFSNPEKLTEEQIKKVEDLVNQKIQENLPVKMGTMTYDEAIKSGALAFFKGKYGEKVKVYTVGPSADSTSSLQASSESAFSREVCGGPHVDFTGKLGEFKIKKEEAAGKGVRRIYASLT